MTDEDRDIYTPRSSKGTYKTMIPEHILEALDLYVSKGTPVWSKFIENIISDNLVGSYQAADDYNISIMKAYAQYCYHDMPIDSRGSMERYYNWVKRGGLEGQRKEMVKRLIPEEEGE